MFDGAYLWITCEFENAVKKLQPSDGATVGSYTVGSHPWDIAFDGSNMWVTNLYDNTVTKLRASDGNVVGTYNVGVEPYGVCYDGYYIWVTYSPSATSNSLLCP